MEKLNILVVDDKKAIGDLFDFALGFGGHAITVANSVKAAIEAVKNKKFDIVFLDIVMPDKDGVEILEDIKDLLPALPVVMMSGYTLEDKKLKAQELGAVGYLKKPFEIDDVKQIMKDTLGKNI